MQANEKKYLSGTINAEDADFAVAPDQYINAENVRFGSTDKGAVGAIESIGSTIQLSSPQPSVTFMRIGSVEDTQNNRFIYFLYNTTGRQDKIMCFTSSGIIYTVLLSAQVTGGLNFSKNFPIHSARVVNGILYWCDTENNEPRRININAGINLNHPGTFPSVSAYVSPLAQSDIAWIRRQPAFQPTVAKDTDPFYNNNFIATEAMQFAWRYISREYETSTLSPFSKLANYNKATDLFNMVTVTLPTGEKILQDVLQVDLVVKYAVDGSCFVIKSWNKTVSADLTSINNHNSGTPLTFNFYNDFTGVSLDSAYSVKPFDSLPIYAWTMEVARNRAFLGYGTMGYDTPTVTSLAVGTSTQSDGGTNGKWIKIDYNSGLNTHYFVDLGSTGFYDVSPQPTPPPYPSSTVSYASLTNIAGGPADFAIYINSHYSGWVGGIQNQTDVAVVGAPAPPSINGKTAFKSDAPYDTSITFYDDAGRKCGYLRGANSIVRIPDRVYGQLNYYVGITWTLSNIKCG
jgi:hypothetical protein